MKGNKLVKILTATLFAATVLTAIAPMEVKAEGHREGCTGADIIWLGGDDNHVASCNGCNVIVSLFICNVFDVISFIPERNN